MRCQDFERLTLESGERELLQEERTALDEHLESCSDCARFWEFWKSLRTSGLGQSPPPELRAELAEKTRLRCHSEIDSFSHRRGVRESGSRPASTPWPVLLALLVLTGLTVIFLIPALEAFFETQKVTVGTILVFFLVLQNAVMLLFAPVLLRRGRLYPFEIQIME